MMFMKLGNGGDYFRNDIWGECVLTSRFTLRFRYEIQVFSSLYIFANLNHNSCIWRSLSSGPISPLPRPGSVGLV
jgi:hypothetical protein